MIGFEDYLKACQTRIDSYLHRHLRNDLPQLERLYAAMRYSVMGGGKRIRPMLAYASCKAFGVNESHVDAAAGALELIHAYSLIHDDLPAMDDDDLRRGQPTCHRAFDEATAILAGDALQALAFEWISSVDHWQAATRLQMTALLARAAGPQGMVGGQAIDLGAVGQQLQQHNLEDMHQRKTGALICASVQLGALASERVTPEQLVALDRYAECIGLAFQIQDDILDVEGNTDVLGKNHGADAARGKPTFPALLGLERAHELARSLSDQAIEALDGFDDQALRLRQLARYIVERQF
ncbi:MAG: (2E,6E)-farnesyl diphosphate synthase [Pseudomonas sp.]